MGRRDRGSGTVRKRSDGRWEGRVLVGYDEKDFPRPKTYSLKQRWSAKQS